MLAAASPTRDTAIWSQQVAKLVQNAEQKRPERKTVKVFKLSRSSSGEVVLIALKDFTGDVDATASNRATKFAGNQEADPSKLSEWFEGKGVYSTWLDDTAWEALRVWAEQKNAQSEEIRWASRSMAVALCVRAGVTKGGTLSFYDLDWNVS